MTFGELANTVTSDNALSDEEVVARVLAGETTLFEIVMRRYNQRLYRLARAVLRNDGEAEDVMQDAYVRAYEHLGQFAGKAKFSTWLSRIALYEALARQRRGRRYQPMPAEDGDPVNASAKVVASKALNPEEQVSNWEVRGLLEEAVEQLPDTYRTVFMLRDVEEMSASDTATVLQISEDNVKVRLHRARVLLRRTLYERAGMGRREAFSFGAARCDRVVQTVLDRIQKHPLPDAGPAEIPAVKRGGPSVPGAF